MIALMAAVASGAAWSSVASAQTTVATIPQTGVAVGIRAYAGRLVWSAYDPASRRYFLTELAGGVVRAVPVEPRTVPFDIDLGPAPSGQSLATYSRCSEEPLLTGADGPDYNARSDCDIYAYDFATRRELRLRGSSRSASEYLPTVWGGRVAFVRTYFRRSPPAGRRPHLYITSLTRRSKPRRLRGGRRHLPRRIGGVRTPRAELVPYVNRLDLERRRLVFSWSLAVDRSRGPAIDQVRLATTTGRTGSVIDQASVSGEERLSKEYLKSPLIAAGAIYYERGSTGESTAVAVQRYDFSTKRARSIKPLGQYAGSLAVDGGLIYWLTPAPPYWLIRQERL